MGLEHPRMIEVPLLTPRSVVAVGALRDARQVVGGARGGVGLTEDLLAADDRFWRLIDHPNRLTFAEAARRALDAERSRRPVPGAWGAIERARGLAESAGVNGDAREPRAARAGSSPPARARLRRRVDRRGRGRALVGIWLAVGGAAIVLGRRRLGPRPEPVAAASSPERAADCRRRGRGRRDGGRSPIFSIRWLRATSQASRPTRRRSTRRFARCRRRSRRSRSAPVDHR